MIRYHITVFFQDVNGGIKCEAYPNMTEWKRSEDMLILIDKTDGYTAIYNWPKVVYMVVKKMATTEDET